MEYDTEGILKDIQVPEDTQAEDEPIGITTFDDPTSRDTTVTVLLSRETIARVPVQSLVIIRSTDPQHGTRHYLGIVVAGPFAEADNLRPDAQMLLTTLHHSVTYVPDYHGRCQVELLGEIVAPNVVGPHRLRPLPQSMVWVMDKAETERLLHVGGDMVLGRAMGHEGITVGIPSSNKRVLPRHLAILGTTGGGKSTTVCRLVAEAQKVGYAVILLDVDGEYTCLAEPATDPTMLAALKDRGMTPMGVANVYLLHLVGRETTNPTYARRRPFSLSFGEISPFTLAEILNLTEAQELRLHRAYDWARLILREMSIYPADADEERDALNLDTFETGLPRLKLQHLIDICAFYVQLLQAKAGEAEAVSARGRRVMALVNPEGDERDADDSIVLGSPEFQANHTILRMHIRREGQDTELSWVALLARLHHLRRFGVFDREDAGSREGPLDYGQMMQPGRVCVVDLSDTDSAELRNLAITQVLANIQKMIYDSYDRDGRPPTKALIIIEEAHEFLSAARIGEMPLLFEQVARISKRGRKRWLSMAFVSQMPQHLPREVLGLVNNHILHKMTDPATLELLQRSIAGINPNLWQQLPNLAPGQAIVNCGHMARPLLVAIDPAPAKLRMTD